MEADKKAADRGESVTLMEPLLIGGGSRHRGAITDLALELTRKAAGFRRSLPPSLLASLADLVRSMNCYYSNLIEGHDTHPVDIERALKNDYSQDTRKRELATRGQSAHQRPDNGSTAAASRAGLALTGEGIRDIHRRFCELLPEDLLWVEDPATKERATGCARRTAQRDVRVGTHIAVSPGAVPRFLKRFGEVYAQSRQDRVDPLHRRSAPSTAVDASLPRWQWACRAPDVARDVAGTTRYRRRLVRCARPCPQRQPSTRRSSPIAITPRRNDLDGRGTLSEEALAEFTRFFLEVCIDQVDFMESLVQPDRLRARILLWAEEEIRLGHLPAKSGSILEAVLYRGELPRGDADAVLGTGERQARRIVAALLEKEVLASESPRAPLRLAFPATLASRWMPGLFPEK